MAWWRALRTLGILFVWKKTGESQAGVIIDGDLETFDAGTRVAQSAIAGGADTEALEAAQLLDVEVEELAGMVASSRSLGLPSCSVLGEMTGDLGEGLLMDGIRFPVLDETHEQNPISPTSRSATSAHLP
ncbi:MAG: hypothetical protein QOD99_2510 [Chthoniobacter sp.]|jgi:hypothetical protein|nr:hypothetical protein [Chthoniobacter sp.]